MRRRAVPHVLKCVLSILLFSLLTGPAGAADRPVDFDTEIIPVLTKSGCNAGACHGAAIGRGGFKLSLYGGNPAADYTAIVRQLEGRRVNLAHPNDSLLLRKPTLQSAHGGGMRFAADSAGATRFRRWIAAGTPRTGKRRLTELTISPEQKILAETGDSVTLSVKATFSDGTTDDVTAWTVFKPEDDSAVTINAEKGPVMATVRRRGEQIVIARFLDRVVPIRLIVPLADVAVDHSKQRRNGFIDEFVLRKLETLRLPVSPPVDDATFLRRVTLDLTGRLPSPNDVKTFLADNRKDKRERLVDRLLKSDAFVDYWAFRFAKLLRIRSQPKDAQGAAAYNRWLREQLRRGTPYTEWARTLMTATGDSHKFGPANFYRTTSGPRAQAEFASELFMGVRLRCANCHNHPLDRWTQDDYHGFAALFAKVKSGRVVSLGTRGEVTHPRTGEPARPRIPGVRFVPQSGRQSDGRKVFADWLTQPGNPFFAKAIVNRLWKAMMGRGLVEPVDDLRATNPATHPELLTRLAEDFEKHGYDLRHTLRRIAMSAAYSRSRVPVHDESTGLSNVSDDRYYSRRVVRELEPEILVDAVCDVTGVPEKFDGLASGIRAVNVFDGRASSEALDILGRCDRSGSCESGGNSGGGLTAKLHWINGKFLNAKIAEKSGRLHQLINGGKADAEIVETFYLLALSRKPSAKERRFWAARFRKAGTSQTRTELLEDFLWSLLSCREFRTR